MNVDEFYQSDWLKASDLQGREVPVTIERCEAVEFDDGKKPVVYFEGKEKGLVLNKTNSYTIANTYGREMDDWHGHEIILCPGTTQFQGKTVPCIRLRVPVQQADDSDEIPF